jgi:hypothetical protein
MQCFIYFSNEDDPNGTLILSCNSEIPSLTAPVNQPPDDLDVVHLDMTCQPATTLEDFRRRIDPVLCQPTYKELLSTGISSNVNPWKISYIEAIWSTMKLHVSDSRIGYSTILDTEELFHAVLDSMFSTGLERLNQRYSYFSIKVTVAQDSPVKKDVQSSTTHKSGKPVNPKELGVMLKRKRYIN